MRTLLDLGVSATDRERLAWLLTKNAAAKVSASETIEPVFDRMLAGQIEVHLHPDYFNRIVPPEDAATLVGVRDGVVAMPAVAKLRDENVLSVLLVDGELEE